MSTVKIFDSLNSRFGVFVNLGYDYSMTRITVNEPLLDQLGAVPGEAEVCDASGRRVGYFLSDHLYRQLVCRWMNTKVSDEELNRCRQETESYSTAEVLNRLRSV
jgi:hypothetical protein